MRTAALSWSSGSSHRWLARSNRNDLPPSLHGHYPASSLLHPSPAHRYFRPRGTSACIFSLTIAGQVLTFHTKAWSSFAPPVCRMPFGPSQAPPELIPEEGEAPGFDIILSFRHLQRIACARLSRPRLPESRSGFSATFTTIAFDDSSLRWLETST